MEPPSFLLNGERVEVGDQDPNTTLLQFLRDGGWTGTKEGCAEGECGACAVALVDADGDGSRLVAVNACLLLLGSVVDREVRTVEGVATGGELHPVQRAMVDHGGSQCGYCTPGFVMSLYAEYYRKGRREPDPEAIAGNLCRCTGYRPIRSALASLPVVDAVDAPAPDAPAVAASAVAARDAQARRLEAPAPSLAAFEHGSGARRFVRPTTLDALWDTLSRHPEATLVAGGTDLVVEMNQHHRRHDVIVTLDAIDALQTLREDHAHLTIGAGVPLADLETRLHGRVTALDQLWPLFSSRLIRRRATLGGNLVNASPIGDSPPVLLALDAEVELARRDGRRWAPLDGFFTGYRATVLERGEILTAVRIPKPLPSLSRFYKVSKRVADDISTVAAAFALERGEDGTVTKARVAYGGVAPTPVRLHAVEAALTGRHLLEALPEAQRAADAAVSPIDDHRGSAGYRRAMVTSLLAKLAAALEESHP